MKNFILLPFLLSSTITIILTSIPSTAATTSKFTCIDMSTSITSQWLGNVEFKFFINLVSTFTDWRIELHFDQPVYKLEQWFGTIDNSMEIVHEKERVFILKYHPTSGKLALSSKSYQFYVIASYSGAIEPKVQQAVLCGMTDAVYQRSVPPIKTFPAMFSNAAIQKCIVGKRSDWGGTIQETITFPVTKDTEGWFVELKFDQTWTRIDQWTCKKISSDDIHFVCQNLNHNGILKAGSSLSIKYQVSYGHQAPRLVEAWFNNYHCSSAGSN